MTYRYGWQGLDCLEIHFIKDPSFVEVTNKDTAGRKDGHEWVEGIGSVSIEEIEIYSRV